MREDHRLAFLLSLAAALPGCGEDSPTTDAATAPDQMDQAVPLDLSPPPPTLSFAAPRLVPAGMALARPGYPRTQPVVVGDFDGDKLIDLAVPNSEGVVLTALLGDGKGGFGVPLSIPVKGRPTSLVAADLDGNGRDELIAGYDGNKLTTASCRPNRIFDASVDLDWPDGTYVLAGGDFNGDGKPDVVAGPMSGNGLTLGLGDGKGGLSAQAAYPFPGPAVLLSVGDLDGDGRTDVALSESFQYLDLLLSTGSALKLIRQLELPGATVDSAVIADFDGNHFSDVLMTPSSVGFQVYLGGPGTAGDGGVVPPIDWRAGQGAGMMGGMMGHANGAGVADLDGDGDLDVALAHDRDEEIELLAGDGKGGFTLAQHLPLGSIALGLVVRDLDGDGRPDLVATTGMGPVAVLMNTSR